jgi:hypothetical protein
MFAHWLLIDDGWFYPNGYKFNLVLGENITKFSTWFSNQFSHKKLEVFALGDNYFLEN